MRNLKLHVAFALFAVLPLAAQNDGTAAERGPIVVMITIDGFPARALKDPRLPMPNLRRLEADGSHADAMIPINPTVTWPNHTALITGVNATEHHVIANGLLVFPADGTAPQVKPWVPKDALVHARTLYDALADKGMSTGQVDWVAIYGAKNVQWEFGEKPEDGPIPRDLIRANLLTDDELKNFGTKSSPAWHDQIWTDAGIDILTHHTPNLLLLHLLETDTIQHQQAPLTPAAYAAYAYADACIGRVVEAARTAGLLDRITFVLTSDHGFAAYTHTVRPNVVLAQNGLLQMRDGKYRGTTWVLPEGGEASVYIRDDAHRAELTGQLKADFEKVDGVAAVYTNAEAQKLGVPALGSSDQAPDLYLAAKPGYSFAGGEDGPIVSDVAPARGAHGYVNSDPDMEALFIISGAHIQSGVNLGRMSNLRVAPTLAHLLGVSLPAAREPALKEALK